MCSGIEIRRDFHLFPNTIAVPPCGVSLFSLRTRRLWPCQIISIFRYQENFSLSQKNDIRGDKIQSILFGDVLWRRYRVKGEHGTLWRGVVWVTTPFKRLLGSHSSGRILLVHDV